MSQTELQNLLNKMSEAKLFQLVTLVQKLARRSALDGDNPGELTALRELQSATQRAHAKKLNGSGDDTF